MRNRIIIFTAALLLAGCGKNEITMPVGPKGDNGLTAYQVWVQAVNDGILDWDKNRTTESDYFIYIAGADGKDGKDGAAGESAYELWREYIKGGNVDDPQNPGLKWDPSKNTEKDFYVFLTGSKGDDGNVPYVGENGNWHIRGIDTGVPSRGLDGKDGKDGKDGADGIGCYEEWLIAVKKGTIIYNGERTITDYYLYLAGKDGKDGKNGANGKDGRDGKDGADGVVPHVGDNGNWYVGSTDTGVPANGKNGRDGDAGDDGSRGKTAYEIWKEQVTSESGIANPGNGIYDIGEYPIWPKDKTSMSDFWKFLRGKSGGDGIDGNDAKNAYELWKDYVKGGEADNPHAPGEKWPAADTTIQHYYYYLTGANGLSSYEIWKADVLDGNGLPNPGNGIYDITTYPKWPAEHVSITDYYLYFRGVDGRDGSEGNSGYFKEKRELEYAGGIIEPYKYTLAPVKAVMRIEKKSLSATPDTTYEYVNPISGGMAYMLIQPGPVRLPNATVKVEDELGHWHTWTSDEEGYIYLSREELPEWTDWSPSGGLRLYPKEITILGTTYPEASEIFGGKPVLPYRVDLTASLEDAKLSGRGVAPVANAYRIIEGRKEIYAWPGKSYQKWSADASDYPDVRTKYFRNSDDSRRAAETLYELTRFIVKSDLNAFSTMDVSAELSTGGQETTREITDGNAKATKYGVAVLGDGINPTKIGVHENNYRPVKYADYGHLICTFDIDGRVFEIPELHYMGDVDEGSSSYEMSEDRSSAVLRLALDPASFGTVFTNETYVTAGSGLGASNVSEVIRFRSCGNLAAYLTDAAQGAERTEYFWGSVAAGSANAQIRASVSAGSASLGISSLGGVVSDTAIEYSDFLGRGAKSPDNSSYDYVLYAGRKGKFTTTSMGGTNSTLTLGTKTYSIKTTVTR